MISNGRVYLVFPVQTLKLRNFTNLAKKQLPICAQLEFSHSVSILSSENGKGCMPFLHVKAI